MSYNLTREEQETVIVFNEAENTAHITTFNGALIRKLTALCESRPNEATVNGPSSINEYIFNVPKKWIKVNASLILSDEQKKALSERGKRNTFKKKQI
jgi:hypothetical protein